MIRPQLTALRARMAQHGMFAYLVVTSDFHSSEYVGEYFKARQYISGFTGSAGTLVVTDKEAGLWTDGRYFLQAASELAGSGIDLYRMGQPGVPTVKEFLVSAMKESAVLGMDGRTVPASMCIELENALAAKNVRLEVQHDLAGEIWEDRPPMSDKPAWALDDEYAGVCAADKLGELRQAMENEGCDAHIMAGLDDICWLFNIRGTDVTNTPMVLAFAAVEPRAAYLFMDEAKAAPIREQLDRARITLRPYSDAYEYAGSCAGKHVMLDPSRVNMALYERAKRSGAILIERTDPTQLMKAVKNPTELEHLRSIHIPDGVAVARTMRYVKEYSGGTPLTELDVARFIDTQRANISGYISPSFDTICGFGAHGAIMHYSATEESNAPIAKDSFVLLDSGGQYLTGTTDITRTFVTGAASDMMKQHFAVVLRSMLSLASARFMQGCSGMNLDILARGPFWDSCLDYNHGTGHGVGFVSGVHEGPNAFRWKKTPGRNESAPLEPGMVTTDEPGIYLEGKYGIRLENELVCVKDELNEYGQFLRFECLTYAPIDLDAVEPKYLSELDRERLNQYHSAVYEKLSPHMTAEEQVWLLRATRAI